MIGERRRAVMAAILGAAAVAMGATGCGGGGGDSMSGDEVVAQIEQGCERLSGTTVWLPEHLEKANMSAAEGQAIVEKAAAEFHDLLEGLDPPAELREPLGRLVDFRLDDEFDSRADFLAQEQRLIELYRDVGAERCRQGVEAGVLSFKGMAVEDAYRRVGAPLPPHPPGW